MGALYLPAGLAASAGEPSASPQQATAILTTAGNQSVIVNGASANSGATIMPGAVIETPSGVGASLSFPGHFKLDLSPGAKVSVEFDGDSIKVTVIQGCVVLHTMKGTTGEIDTSKGEAGKTDGSKDLRLDICDPSIATAPAAVASTGGLSETGGVLIGAAGMATAILVPILAGGKNPSNSAP
jgi:hypothetical protein